MLLLITGALLTLLTTLVTRAVEAGGRPTRQRRRIMADAELLDKLPDSSAHRAELHSRIETDLAAYLGIAGASDPTPAAEPSPKLVVALSLALFATVAAGAFEVAPLIDLSASWVRPTAAILVTVVVPIVVGITFGTWTRRRDMAKRLERLDKVRDAINRQSMDAPPDDYGGK